MRRGGRLLRHAWWGAPCRAPLLPSSISNVTPPPQGDAAALWRGDKGYCPRRAPTPPSHRGGGGSAIVPQMRPVLGYRWEAAGWSPLFQHLLVPGEGPPDPPRCTHGTRLEELLSVANERWGIN